MDKEQARRIIRDTFESSFDKIKFINFAKELFNLKKEHIEHKHPYSGNFIPDAYKQFISTLERIVKYTDGENEIDLLIVKLKKETSLERARTMQRNFIAWYLKGSRGGKYKDAALVAFVSPDEEDWRFSLVKIDYRFNEEGKVDERLSSTKRWSFLVGKNESSHTAQSRLVHILADDQYNPTLTQMEEAFNIEKVTKEFFLKYRNLFLRIKEGLDKVVEDDPKVKKDFAEKGVDTVNFTKKFLGQIVFLYFLQKKGWFGVERDGEWGTGPKDFLRQLFNKEYGNYKNFFNDILEPLFYEALARERDDDFYSRFNCKIPFLNGGLFEPIGSYDWVHTDINLSNELFSNKNDNYEGNGVLDIFDLFNFTVKEDEPLEKEVAIDPELLGKIYEKFNAIRPDNYEEYKKALKSGSKGEENKFNKKFGIYYTPREIVHYMCQESLINYLHAVVNQELMKQPSRAPRQIKLIGPEDTEQLRFHTDNEIVDKKAIEELIKYGEQFTENEQVVEEKKKETNTYKYQLLPDIRKNAKVIDEKLKAIRVCDPAVGSGAFPVGMMAEIVKVRNVLSVYIKEQNRTPYNFKRECIENSLYGVDIDPGAVEIAKLRLWLSLIVDEEDITKIKPKPLPNLDYKIVRGNSLLGVERNLFNNELFSQLELLKPLYFNETNPTKKQEYKKQIDELISKITNGHKEFDFEVYFSEVFHEKKGFDVVIANPPYVDYRGIPKKIIKSVSHYKTNINSLRPNLYMYFIEKGFCILKRDGIFIFINPNQFLSTNAGLGIRKHILEKAIIKFIIDVSYIRVFQEAATYTTIWLFVKKLLPDYKIRFNHCNNLNQLEATTFYSSKKEILSDPFFIIPIEKEYKILQKIEDKRLRLGTFCKMIWGTSKSGYGKLKIKKSEYLKLNDKQKAKYRPILQTRDIKRYYIKWQGEYIPEDIYSDNAKHIFGKKKKILIARVTRKLQCAIDKEGRFIGKATILFNYGVDENYLLGILNSKLINYWYSKKYETTHMASRYLRFDIPYLKQIPITKIPVLGKKPFIELVDKILKITKDLSEYNAQADDYLINSNKQAKVKKYEQQIDQMVYKLYGLNEEEIKIVEKNR